MKMRLQMKFESSHCGTQTNVFASIFPSVVGDTTDALDDDTGDDDRDDARSRGGAAANARW